MDLGGVGGRNELWITCGDQASVHFAHELLKSVNQRQSLLSPWLDGLSANERVVREYVCATGQQLVDDPKTGEIADVVGSSLEGEAEDSDARPRKLPTARSTRSTTRAGCRSFTVRTASRSGCGRLAARAASSAERSFGRQLPP